MRCTHCETEFTPKRTTGKFCSAKCRAAAWQRKRHDELACLEDQAERLLIRIRALQGKP
jgi:hypothetical protein